MCSSLRHLVGWIINAFYSRQDLILENLALRQQLLALHIKRPHRRLSEMHKLFWVALRRLWSGWITEGGLQLVLLGLLVAGFCKRKMP